MFFSTSSIGTTSLYDQYPVNTLPRQIVWRCLLIPSCPKLVHLMLLLPSLQQVLSNPVLFQNLSFVICLWWLAIDLNGTVLSIFQLYCQFSGQCFSGKYVIISFHLCTPYDDSYMHTHFIIIFYHIIYKSSLHFVYYYLLSLALLPTNL